MSSLFHFGRVLLSLFRVDGTPLYITFTLLSDHGFPHEHTNGFWTDDG